MFEVTLNINHISADSSWGNKWADDRWLPDSLTSPAMVEELQEGCCGVEKTPVSSSLDNRGETRWSEMPYQSCYIRIKIPASGLVVFPSPQPPKPPRKSYSMKPTIPNVHEGLQAVYEDPDALRVNTEPGWQRWLLLVSAGESPKLLVCLWQPAFTDGNQTEVIVRPVPRPRSRLPSKPDVLNPRTNDGDEVTHSSSSVVRRPLATHAPTASTRPLSHDVSTFALLSGFPHLWIPHWGLGKAAACSSSSQTAGEQAGSLRQTHSTFGQIGSLQQPEFWGGIWLCWIFHLI